MKRVNFEMPLKIKNNNVLRMGECFFPFSGVPSHGCKMRAASKNKRREKSEPKCPAGVREKTFTRCQGNVYGRRLELADKDNTRDQEDTRCDAQFCKV